MTKLRRISSGLMAISRSRRTLIAYSSAWSSFLRWCNSAGLDSLPCTEDTLILYVTGMLFGEKLYKIATAEHHVAAIVHYHRVAGLPNPNGMKLRTMFSNVRRERKECPQGKEALDALDLIRVAEACDTSTRTGLRDRAIVILGFASCLRRSNIARLQLADVSFQREGLVLRIRYSKTDQRGKGDQSGVWKGERESTDPVRVLKAWISVRGNWPGPLFCRISNHDVIARRGISGEAIHEAFQRAVARIGLDVAKYGAHSMRSGAVTASADLGRSDQEIMGMSGHKTQRVMNGYVRGSRLFSGRNPLQGVL